MDEDSWGLTSTGLGALNEEYRKKWRAVYDPTAYLPYATKPMFFVSGLTDQAFSAVSHKISTALVLGKVFYGYSASLAARALLE